MLREGEKDAKSAVSFEAKARSLRGRALAATKSVGAVAQHSAKAAAANAAQGGLEQARQLMLQAQKLEKSAMAHRNRASQALHRAVQAQDSMAGATKHLTNDVI